MSDDQVRASVLDAWRAGAMARLSQARDEAGQVVTTLRPQLDRVRRDARRRPVPEPTVEKPDSMFGPLQIEMRRGQQQQRRLELLLIHQPRSLRARMSALEAAERDGDLLAVDVLETLLMTDLADAPGLSLTDGKMTPDVQERSAIAKDFEALLARRVSDEDQAQLGAWQTEIEAIDHEWSWTMQLVYAVEHVGYVTPEPATV